MVVEARNIIAGEYMIGGSGRLTERHNPASGELVSRYVESTSDDVNAAVESARYALELDSWSRDPKLRARVLRSIHAVIVRDLEEIGRAHV